LLVAHHGAQLLVGVVGAVERALLAVGHDQGLDLVSLRDQLGDGAPAEERQVIGMRLDDEIAHGLSSPLCSAGDSTIPGDAAGAPEAGRIPSRHRGGSPGRKARAALASWREIRAKLFARARRSRGRTSRGQDSKVAQAFIFRPSQGLLAALAIGLLAASDAAGIEWRPLVPGASYAEIRTDPSDPDAKGRLHVVRVDPALAELRAVMASEHDQKRRSARKWCQEFGLAVAINLGMYQQDHLSNVGYARNGDHVNSARWVSTYKSALGFGPRPGVTPAALVVDLDQEGSRERLDGYGTVVQNLRLIKSPGRNVWSKQEKRWSEAAIGIDGEGRILFLFSREPYAMWEFNRMLLSTPLDVKRAMHAEGGPEASLSIHAGGVDLDLSGSFETGFHENNANPRQWSIPNVLGVKAPPPDASP
jgi:hypothetical protein